MRILFAAAEAAPYFKAGGLGDVARALPDELARRGHDVRIILPAYGLILRRGLDLAHETDDMVPWPGTTVPVRFLRHTHGDGAPAILVHQSEFFEDGRPYVVNVSDPLALGRRFALFCRAVVRYAKAWNADVVHANDWHTGLVPVYRLLDGLDAATIFTIHNLAYQGNFTPELLGQAGVPGELYRPENGVEFYGSVSFMKAGLALADHVTTVSPTYAREVQTPAYGAGLDGLLRFRKHHFSGILNGIDIDAWQPARDPRITAPYTATRLAGKDRNREALLQETGLEDGGPVVAMITRLVHQKGIDLLLAALPALLEREARLVILGDGDAAYEHALATAAKASPRRIAFAPVFDEALARRIYAGADFFLMPSLYEPCGLGQMIAQRYGTLPIVRATGGLVDTVEDGKTGFAFRDASVSSLLDAWERARTAWRARGWVSMRRRAMRLDWSWGRSAQQYERVYSCMAGKGGA